MTNPSKNKDRLITGLAATTLAVLAGSVIAVPFVGLLPVIATSAALAATAFVAKAVESHCKNKNEDSQV